MKCKNCGHEFEGNFCSHCGQNADVHRFNFLYFLKETFFSSLDIENGFFNTLKQLALNPGKAIKEYLEGKRVSLYVPGKFLLLIGTVATFLVMQFDLYLSEKIGSSFDQIPMLTDFLNFAEEYNTVINVITIPVFAFGSYLVFYKHRYNFTEHLILNIYITSEQLAFLIFIAPFLIFGVGEMQYWLYFYGLATFVYNIWVYCEFFNLPRVKGIVLSLITLIFGYVLQFIINYLFYRIASPFL